MAAYPGFRDQRQTLQDVRRCETRRITGFQADLQATAAGKVKRPSFGPVSHRLLRSDTSRTQEHQRAA